MTRPCKSVWLCVSQSLQCSQSVCGISAGAKLFAVQHLTMFWEVLIKEVCQTLHSASFPWLMWALLALVMWKKDYDYERAVVRVDAVFPLPMGIEREDRCEWTQVIRLERGPWHNLCTEFRESQAVKLLRFLVYTKTVHYGRSLEENHIVYSASAY